MKNTVKDCCLTANKVSMKLLPKLLTVVLAVVFLADLYFVWQGNNEPRFFTKTLLLPLLLLIYLSESKLTQLAVNQWFAAGLVLSFFGDLFLLFQWGFLPGLGSFLLAHIFYIICFRKLVKSKASRTFIFILSLYLIGFIAFLYPYLNEMKFPVIVYGIVISLMLYFASRTGNKLLILGALLFVISDTILAVNLFMNETKLQSLLVMITYVFAQWFLVRGILKEKELRTDFIHNIQ